MEMKHDPVIEQRIKQLEEGQKQHQDDIKDLNRRVNTHDTSMAKIELIAESLKKDWDNLRNDLKSDVKNMLENNTQNNENNMNAWMGLIKEGIKMTTYIVGAILAAKIFWGK